MRNVDGKYCKGTSLRKWGLEKKRLACGKGSFQARTMHSDAMGISRGTKVDEDRVQDEMVD